MIKLFFAVVVLIGTPFTHAEPSRGLQQKSPNNFTIPVTEATGTHRDLVEKEGVCYVNMNFDKSWAPPTVGAKVESEQPFQRTFGRIGKQIPINLPVKTNWEEVDTIASLPVPIRNYDGVVVDVRERWTNDRRPWMISNVTYDGRILKIIETWAEGKSGRDQTKVFELEVDPDFTVIRRIEIRLYDGRIEDPSSEHSHIVCGPSNNLV